MHSIGSNSHYWSCCNGEKITCNVCYRYPQEVMNEVNGLAAQLAELADYRKDKQRREANRIKFVQSSSGKN